MGSSEGHPNNLLTPEGADIFEAVSESRRRQAILLLSRSDGGLPLGVLAEMVAAIEGGESYWDVGSKERKTVMIALYQSHADKLAEAGLVSYEERETFLVANELTHMAAEMIAEQSAALGLDPMAEINRVLEEAGCSPWEPGRPVDIRLYRVPTGEEFRELREAAGVTQVEIAEEIGFSSGSISTFETGEAGISVGRLRDAIECIREAWGDD